MQVKGLAAVGEVSVLLNPGTTTVLTWLGFVLCDAQDLKWANDIHCIKSIVEAEQDLIRLSNGQKQSGGDWDDVEQD